MNKYFMLFLIMLLFASLTGCASKHYIENTPDSLTFFLRVEDASRVQLASSDDNFVLHDTVQNSSGVWQLSVPMGSELKYFYIVDGTTYLPECRFRETDDFGSENCLYLPKL